jgi:hypothetical protein
MYDKVDPVEGAGRVYSVCLDRRAEKASRAANEQVGKTEMWSLLEQCVAKGVRASQLEERAAVPITLSSNSQCSKGFNARQASYIELALSPKLCAQSGLKHNGGRAECDGCAGGGQSG